MENISNDMSDTEFTETEELKNLHVPHAKARNSYSRPDLHISSKNLSDLAHIYGIDTSFEDKDGNYNICTEKGVRACLESIYNLDLSTEEKIEDNLRKAEDACWVQHIANTIAIIENEKNIIDVYLPANIRFELVAEKMTDAEVVMFDSHRLSSIEIATNNDAKITEENRIDDIPYLHYEVEINDRVYDELDFGYYDLFLCGKGEEKFISHSYLIYAPDRINISKLGKSAWGIMAQLYSVRSHTSWGIGDFNDMKKLVELGKEKADIDFLLVNPMNATSPVAPVSDSPYLPYSRYFFDEIYIYPQGIPEYDELPKGDKEQIKTLWSHAQENNYNSELLYKNEVFELKRKALKIIYDQKLSSAREAELYEYSGGSTCIDNIDWEFPTELEKYAIWCTLCEVKGMPHTDNWYGKSTCASEEVKNIIVDNCDTYKFYIWLQWIAHSQLQAVKKRAEELGMPIGIIGDLPVGEEKLSPTNWSDKTHVYVDKCEVGTPPDSFSSTGQNWSQLPYNPITLEVTGYRFIKNLFEAYFSVYNAVRVDHILGLTRLWCIPEGCEITDGCYINYDYKILFAILCLEAHLNNAIIIGENLGSVEPGLNEYLDRKNILGTVVMHNQLKEKSIVAFNKFLNNDFTELEIKSEIPESIQKNLIAITTHDETPLYGYLSGSCKKTYLKAGMVEKKHDILDDLDAKRLRLIDFVKSRSAQSDKLKSMLSDLKSLPSGSHTEDDDTVLALHEILAESDYMLKCVCLVDIAKEKRNQNIPATFYEYPNWRIPLANENEEPVLIEEVFDTEFAQKLSDIMNSNRHRTEL